MRFLKSAITATAILLMPGIAAAQGSAPASPPAADGWQRIVPEPVTIDGRRFTPTCSNAPGTTTSTFSYYFRKGTADGLVVFFNGGGACWNDATCSKPRLAGDRAVFSGPDDEDAFGVYKSELLPGDGPSRMNGMFDRTNAQNPVRDWSMIFVPYCTGDVHSGSNSAQYKEPGTGKPFTIEHRGWDNMQVIMHWMRSNVPPPAQMLVSGSSAGAYGAATHYTSLRTLYPNARSAFLGDSGQGVTTPEFERGRNANWNYQLPSSIFGANAQNTPDAEVVAKLAAHFQNDRFTQFTSFQDATQTAFLAQMRPPGACNAWTNQMSRELAKRQAASNFRSYVAQGNTHTILRAPLFYTEQSTGMNFTAWLGALVQNNAMPGNQSCPTCQAPQGTCTE